jgi:hypothetical protein
MSDQQTGKREIEREYLDLFLEAYERATDETFLELISETPDFIARDKNNLLAGIEITSLRFSPEERQIQSISAPRPGDFDAWYQLHALIVKEEKSLLQGRWPECARKILAIVMLDASIADTRRVTGSWGCAMRRRLIAQCRNSGDLLLSASNRVGCNWV